MNKIFILVFLFSVSVQAKTIKVAVIDTGFDFTGSWPNIEAHGLALPKFCAKGGHKDFTTPIPVPDGKLDKKSKEYKNQWNKGLEAVARSYTLEALQDNNGHGTHIAGLIAKYADNADYCIIAIKFYDRSRPGNNLVNMRKSIQYAISLGVDVINVSGGGTDYDEKEKQTVVKALDMGITFIAAAGNERSNIDKNKYYPAMYDSRVVVVENWIRKPLPQMTGHAYAYVCPSSNYSDIGSTDGGEFGEDVYSLFPMVLGGYGKLTGTSQATAIRTGKVVKQLSDAYNINIDLILQRIKRTKNMA